MMIEGQVLFRAASVSASVALVSLILAGIALGLFFGGAGQIFGPINDVFAAIMLLALIAPILAVDRAASEQVGIWLRVVTVAAIAGAVLAAVGQLALVVGIIDLETSFVTGGIGFLPVLIWIVALAVLGAMGVAPPAVGWSAAVSLGLIVLASIVIMITTGPLAWLAWSAVVVGLSVWLWTLASWFTSLAPGAVALPPIA